MSNVIQKAFNKINSIIQYPELLPTFLIKSIEVSQRIYSFYESSRI